MIGARVYFAAGEPFDLKPGEYGKHPGNGLWYCCTPNGEAGNLSRHTVTEHEDGTITVSPSILVTMRVDGKDVDRWHGFLERGVWRQC